MKLSGRAGQPDTHAMGISAFVSISIPDSQ
jgi:hypothetical protein